MKRTGKLSSYCLKTTAALLLVACTSAAPAADPAVQANAAPVSVPEQIADLAERGMFAELDHLIAGLPNKTEQSAELSKSIKVYQDHLATRRQAKQADYDEALKEMQAELDKGKIQDAIIEVIKAHSLTDHPDKLLGKPAVAALIKQVTDKAKAASDNGDIVDAVSLYRLLDLLYEDERTYHQSYLDAAAQVRVLQMYNPKLLRNLYMERAKKLGNADDLKLFEEAEQQELEDWTIKLADIKTAMLGQAMTYAAERHIDKAGYATLVLGAAKGLTTMVQTDGLGDVFPNLKDKEKRDKLLADIKVVIDDVSRPGRVLTRGAAMSLLAEMMQANEQSIKLPENVVIYELASGATDELDPFSSVIWPEDIRQFERSIHGKFVGIGVQIQKLDGMLTVVTPLENTPAMRAGLKAQDVIAKVNGAPTIAWTVDHAVREITGPEDTKVTLTIKRKVDDKVEFFDVTLTRKPINIESIKGFEHRDEGGWDYWVDKESGIGYIRMTQFLRQTAEDMDVAVKQLKKEGQLNGIVLDLRFNPGGLLSTAIGVVDRFVDKGRIVATVNAEGRATSSHSAGWRNTYDDDIDLVILINQGSASASEIVSGALQDYERAIILGENSYGKGSVQDIFTIAAGSAAFKCTTQYYQLPMGRIIHRKDDSKVWGIQPDLEIKMTNEEVGDWLEARRDADILYAPEDRDPDNPQTDPNDIFKDGLDPQLEAAVLLLKARQLSSDKKLAKKAE